MTLIAIGGAEDKTGDLLVHRRVLAEARGACSRVCVVTSASSDPQGTRERYAELYHALGVATVDFLHIDSTAMANSPEVIDILRQADVVFMTGGDQSKLSEALDGTRALALLHQRYGDGHVVIAGTSAGAAAAARLMMAGGRPELAMYKGEVILSGRGLGFVPDAVIDTHFSERNRLSRLFSAVAQHPQKLGIGLDEDTALVLRRRQPAEVIGSGAVTIVDGRHIRSNNAAQIRNGGRIVVTGLKVHTLRSGARFDMGGRKPL